MKCRKCKATIPNDSKYCCACGAKQSVSRNTKNRGNGTGSVYQLANKRWIAIKTIGYKPGPSGKNVRLTRSKSGFKTKREAIEYLPQLTASKTPKSTTFRALFDMWRPTHRAGKSTMGNYDAAVKYFEPVWYLDLQDITIDDLQDCIGECPKGKRTHENMKALCGLLYKYAIPRHLSDINLGQYLVVGGSSSSEKTALPDTAVKAIEANVGRVDGADYVMCHCYLGFRPSELLALDVINYNRRERAFVGGSKTDAGRDRVVTVSPKIQPIVDRLTADKIAGPVFCSKNGSRMPIKAYRALFYRVLDECGIANPVIVTDGVRRRKYTPHSCRHTFATLMKRVSAADKDKLELMGHTSTEMLRYYQDVSCEDLRRATDQM